MVYRVRLWLSGVGACVCEKGVDGLLCGAQTHKCQIVLYTGLYCTVLYNITSQPLRQRVVLYTVLYFTNRFLHARHGLEGDYVKCKYYFS